ncbi:hypothetical protein GGI35DRAFT_55670 [Trichoderma velutinum]
MYGVRSSGGGTSRMKQGTVTPHLALACQRLHRSSHRHGRTRLGRDWRRGPRLDPGTGARRCCELGPLTSRQQNHPQEPTSLHARVQYSTVQYSAVCARVRVGACTAQAGGWWALYEQEQHQADSPFHTRRLPKASHDAAIDGDTDTHMPDNSPPDGPRDACADVRYQACVLLTDTCSSSTAVP